MPPPKGPALEGGSKQLPRARHAETASGESRANQNVGSAAVSQAKNENEASVSDQTSSGWVAIRSDASLEPALDEKLPSRLLPGSVQLKPCRGSISHSRQPTSPRCTLHFTAQSIHVNGGLNSAM